MNHRLHRCHRWKGESGHDVGSGAEPTDVPSSGPRCRPAVILVEEKAIREIGPVERAPVLSYLRATGYRRPPRINFGADRGHDERIVHQVSSASVTSVANTFSPPRRTLVAGRVGQNPSGGVAWDHLRYFVGLADVGHHVTYPEDAGCWPFHLGRGHLTGDYTPSVAVIGDFFARFAAHRVATVARPAERRQPRHDPSGSRCRAGHGPADRPGRRSGPRCRATDTLAGDNDLTAEKFCRTRGDPFPYNPGTGWRAGD